MTEREDVAVTNRDAPLMLSILLTTRSAGSSRPGAVPRAHLRGGFIVAFRIFSVSEAVPLPIRRADGFAHPLRAHIARLCWRTRTLFPLGIGHR